MRSMILGLNRKMELDSCKMNIRWYCVHIFHWVLLRQGKKLECLLASTVEKNHLCISILLADFSLTQQY